MWMVALLLFPIQAGAVNIIRDSEIEHAIWQVIAPVAKAANLKRLKIHILSDDAPNAFTAGGEEIFFSSGLITNFPDPEIVRGVAAHEIGHILGKHVLRQLDNIEQQSKVAASSVAIGLASALAGNPVLAIGAMMGGMHYSERSILKSSRVYEASADQAGLKLLEKSGNTSEGLLKLLKYFNARQNKLDLNPYELTHPLSSERVNTMLTSYEHSKFKHGTTSPNIRYNFLTAAAKLKAFTVNLSHDHSSPEVLLKNEAYNGLSHEQRSKLETYIRAIIAFRKSDMNKALSYIDSLITGDPTNPYYYELKGQICFEFGKKEAYTYYAKATSLLPSDPLLRLGKAAVELSVFEHDKPHIMNAISDLKFSRAKDKDNILPYYFLSVAYEKIGDKPHSLLAVVSMTAERGDMRQARSMARSVIKDFKPDTPEWHKLNDIITQEE